MQVTGKVGLFGAAGAAGQIIAAALSAAGRDYRVVGRPASHSRPRSATIRMQRSSHGIPTIRLRSARRRRICRR